MAVDLFTDIPVSVGQRVSRRLVGRWGLPSPRQQYCVGAICCVFGVATILFYAFGILLAFRNVVGACMLIMMDVLPRWHIDDHSLGPATLMEDVPTLVVLSILCGFGFIMTRIGCAAFALRPKSKLTSGMRRWRMLMWLGREEGAALTLRAYRLFVVGVTINLIILALAGLGLLVPFAWGEWHAGLVALLGCFGFVCLGALFSVPAFFEHEEQ